MKNLQIFHHNIGHVTTTALDNHSENNDNNTTTTKSKLTTMAAMTMTRSVRSRDQVDEGWGSRQLSIPRYVFFSLLFLFF